MSAYEIPNLRWSAEADGAAVEYRRFVKVTGDGKVKQTVAGEAAIGVTRNKSASGEVVEINDGIVIVEAGAAITAGAAVQSDADGKAVTLAAGTKNGIALTSAGAAGVLVTIKI